MKILILILLLTSILANNIQLNQNVKNTIKPRQNQVYQIESCDDIEIEVSSKGQITVESGPARKASLKGYQEDVKREINNEQIKFTITFPFIHYNIHNRLCLIYLSIYGSVMEDRKETAEYTFIARPKMINDFQIISITKITENQPILYLDSISSLQNKIYLLEVDNFKNTNLNKSLLETDMKITIFDSSPIQHSQLNYEREYDEESMNGLPKLIFNKNVKNQNIIEQQDEQQKIVNNNSEQVKNSFLNFNRQQNVKVNKDKLMFLIENNNNQYESIVQITKSNISQFSSLSNMKSFKFSGLNFSLKKGAQQKVYLNNSGQYILEIYSLQPNKINLVFNTKVLDEKQQIIEKSIDLHIKQINEYSSYTLLQKISKEDYLILYSEEDINVLIELKPISDSIKQQMIEEREEYLDISLDDYIVSIENPDINLAYLFVSDSQENTKNNSIIGESSNGLIHFVQIDPKGFDLNKILDQQNQIGEVYISIRAYDNLNRAFIFKSIQVENPYSEYFTIKQIIPFVILGGILLGIFVFIITKNLKKPVAVKDTDEIELIHKSVHRRLKSDSCTIEQQKILTFH